MRAECQRKAPHEGAVREVGHYTKQAAPGARGRTMQVMQRSPARLSPPVARTAPRNALRCAQRCSAVAPRLARRAATLEYQRGALARQPWRAPHGPSGPHQLAACADQRRGVVDRRPALCAANRCPRRQATALVVSAAGDQRCARVAVSGDRVVSAALSGALHGLFFAGAAKWLLARTSGTGNRAWEALLPAALFAGGWAKVVFEQPAQAELPYAGWLGAAVVPQAHLVGAACGTVLGALFATTKARPASSATSNSNCPSGSGAAATATARATGRPLPPPR